MALSTSLLIIGAGPFGLALAAQAKHLNIDFVMVGKPMGFWHAHMPSGMILRSASGWHLDPLETYTIDAYLKAHTLTRKEVEPLSLERYLDYVHWFQQQEQIDVLPALVQRLDYTPDADHPFSAVLDSGETIAARNVVLAVGLQYFRNIPPEFAQIAPAHIAHTFDVLEFEALRGKRVLVVGGRQSAFEWAALLCDHGAAAVHLVHRHESPAYTESDWTWVPPLVDALVDNPGWFRNLPPEEKDAVNHHMWAEGRLKVEPWLEARIKPEIVKLWPKSQVIACQEQSSGELKVMLDNGTTLTVDQIVLATGYKVDLARVPLLANGNILSALVCRNGYPALDEQFQSSIPGLYFTGIAAAQDFGPFFGFTVSVRSAAKIIGRALAGA